MATLDFSTYFFYRWRYILGYGAVGILLIGLLVFAGLFVPGGLSANEMLAITRSEQINYTDFSSLGILNLPYYALQDAILHIFGVSTFAIKLPSLILALLSAVGLIFILRRWFKPNIAVLASLIAVSTGQFLFIAQSGNPSILYIFWPIVLLLLGTQITRQKRHRVLWKVLFGAAAALSLYTPLSVYTLLAILITVVLHPHLRNAVRRLRIWKVALSFFVALLLISPLIYAMVQDPSFGLRLLGIPEAWPPNLAANVSLLLQQYLLFWEPGNTTVMTPVFGLGSALLIGLGLYRLIRTHETTRSYLLITWIILLIPGLVLNPIYTSVMFTISVLLLAAGLTSLIGYWYRLFPRNPYARVAGLIPLVILVAALIGSGLNRYVYSYHYSPASASLFSHDLKLLPSNTAELITSDEERPFYEAVASYRNNMTVTTTPTAETVTMTRNAAREIKGYELVTIITGPRLEEADRFYVYTKIKE